MSRIVATCVPQTAMCDLNVIALNTQDVYRRKALVYDRERVKTLFERVWLERFEKLLPDKARILDIGCGAGEPIAQYFIENDHDLTGIDYARPVIDLARERFPESTWHVADMRSLELGDTFDGIIGWHSFFHLTPDEQRATLRRLADHLKPGGALMLTVGPKAGEVIGSVGGEKVYHSSLSPTDYRRVLGQLDVTVVSFVPEDPNCDFASVLLAQKLRQQTSSIQDQG